MSKLILVEGGIMYIKPISSYLRRLRLIDAQRPEDQRQEIPTLEELGHHIGISQKRLSRMHRLATLNISLASSILIEMNRRGFPMQLADVIGYKPPVFAEPAPPPKPPEPQGIEALVAEYMAADEAQRKMMQAQMPHIVTHIKRQIGQNSTLKTDDAA